MAHRTRTEITIETETVIRLRREGVSVLLHCPMCGGERLMLAPPAASAVAGVSTREMYRLIESGRVHFAEGGGDQLFVCAESLGRRKE